MKHARELLLLSKIQKQRDATAFAELYDEYIARMYRFVAFKVESRQEAEDLTSELFLKLWEYLTKSEQKHIDSLNGLIYRMARNIIIDHYRKGASKKEFGIDEYALMLETGDKELRRVEAKIDAEKLIQTMKQLKQEYQEILLLRYIEELSIKEIAHVMGKKRTNVRVTLHRARTVLEDVYKK